MPIVPHQVREAAESFGADAERYHRTRPRYPEPLIADVVAASPGPSFLDVGVGTGIVARQLAAHGAEVLGVDVDARMAAYARELGVAAEVARFEDWDAGVRTFDAVVAGQTWHWVDPVAGTSRAASVLRPGRLVALFWNVMLPPPGLAEVFVEVYRQVVPDNPAVALSMRPRPDGDLGPYETILARAVAGLRASGGFGEPSRAAYPWELTYERDGWLEQVPTFGGFSTFPPATQRALLDGMAAAVDRLGGRFTMRYVAVAVTATRRLS